MQAGAEGCVSCREGMIFVRKQGRCVFSCPEAYYHDKHHKTCEPCHTSCKTCTGMKKCIIPTPAIGTKREFQCHDSFSSELTQWEKNLSVQVLFYYFGCPLRETVFTVYLKKYALVLTYILNDRQRTWGVWLMSPRIYTITGSVRVTLHHRRVCRVWGKYLFYLIKEQFYLDMHRFSKAFLYVIYICLV